MQSRPAACEEKLWKHLLLGNTVQNTAQRQDETGPLILSPHPPPRPHPHPHIASLLPARLHVIVCQPNLSNQQISTKIIGGGLAASERRAVYR